MEAVQAHFTLLAFVISLLFLSLYGIRRNQKWSRFSYTILSLAPWLHIVLTYFAAFYVRIGFGAWPRSCLDNPNLPLIDEIVWIVLYGMMILFFVILPVWGGWSVILIFKKSPKKPVILMLLFLSGLLSSILLMHFDPWGFWGWILD